MQKVEFGSDNAAHHINAAHVLVVWFQRPPHREARLDSTRQLVPTPQASKRNLHRQTDLQAERRSEVKEPT